MEREMTVTESYLIEGFVKGCLEIRENHLRNATQNLMKEFHLSEKEAGKMGSKAKHKINFEIL